MKKYRKIVSAMVIFTLMSFSMPVIAENDNTQQSDQTCTVNQTTANPADTEDMENILPVSTDMDNSTVSNQDTAQTPSERFVAKLEALPIEKKIVMVVITITTLSLLMGSRDNQCQHCTGPN